MLPNTVFNETTPRKQEDILHEIPYSPSVMSNAECVRINAAQESSSCTNSSNLAIAPFGATDMDLPPTSTSIPSGCDSRIASTAREDIVIEYRTHVDLILWHVLRLWLQ